ncbi:Dol-P-Man:Man(5)GlcNAc(2)-PP-Dol alpha-1,3-mannosyltransferase [Rhizoctonia solani]|uniref:Dol-P-Man:Man(5)GlcNAc(2)-PP-Dol alpha-1,3-mannosyltransferase n=1 Tax=Rhizoctonia solani TaxID=456999 RepID=A0A8H7I6C4_9AGAM|nr:Dol-P-Man:Man(5)GlcNAc(2)-PP-Dol alpha-1,3-mannosyltransferase [Rhizoctonia solani]
MALTFLVYRRAGIPQYVLLLLPLSKRLHSIYVLRLFNDCWSTPLSMGAIHAFQKRYWAIGCILFGLAISIKMNVLLYMPAACLVLLLTNGLIPSLLYLSLTFLAVLIPSLPFLETYPMEYLVNAFDLSRQFLYKWTVNWRFVPEHTFLSAPFAKGLLLCHIILLGTFGFGAWCKKQGGAWSVLERALQNPARETAIASVSQDFVVQTSRQSFSLLILLEFFVPDLYTISSTLGTPPNCPFSHGEPNTLSRFGIIEYAWNTYPSTDLSSGLLLAAHVLLLIGVLFGYPEGTNTSIVRWDDEIEVEKLD